MNETNNEQMWLENNPFFIDKYGYDGFIKEMIMAAQNGELPVCFDYQEADNLTLYDIKQFSQLFFRDAGLTLTCQLATCPDCGKLHCLLNVSSENPFDEQR